MLNCWVIDALCVFQSTSYISWSWLITQTGLSKGKRICECAEERLARVDVIIFMFVLPKVDLIIHSHIRNQGVLSEGYSSFYLLSEIDKEMLVSETVIGILRVGDCFLFERSSKDPNHSGFRLKV